MNMKTSAASLDDKRITEFGMLVEATRRLTRIVEVSLRENSDLTMVEFEAMIRLGRSPERQMSMSELGEQMVLTSGGVTRLVDRLTKSGFVDRVSCPSDRRVQWAQLTELGVKTVSEALTAHLAELDDHFFSLMTPNERATTTDVLDRLRTTCSE